MLFNSPNFLLLFLPISALLFYWSPLRRWRLPLILVLSLLFYDVSAGGRQVVLLALSTAWVYWISTSPKAVGGRGRLIFALALPAGILLYYKYAAFLLTSAGLPNLIPPSKGEIPAGISFYVFHLASFAIDRYRGDIPDAPGPLQFASYVSFFPQLVAGPITRFRQVGESIRRLPEFVATTSTVWGAMAMFSVGLASKLLLADPLMIFLAPLLKEAGSLDRLSTIYLVLAYSFRIYFDFYGYSMMAMGLGMAFGVVLPRNFDRPYLSANPKEFWRRWHKTLSSWIRDYLYIPLGGNRHYIRNILIVFAACGLWHGAGWNFVVWGLYHGALILIYAATQRVWDRLPAPAAQALTFTLVSCGWPLFALDLSTFATMANNMIVGGGTSLLAISVSGWAMVAAAALVTFTVDTDKLARSETGTTGYVVRQVVLAVLTVASLTLFEGSQPFIYFQF